MNKLSQLAKAVGEQLKQQSLMVVTAESCTGGGLAYWFTSVPGSSDWFDRGFITYQNAAKQQLLDVSSTTLHEYGAVSEPVVIEMAQGALEKSSAQVSIAITGIAGPDGGTIEKPIGLVFIAWIVREKLIVEKTIFAGDRAAIREQAIELALTRLVQELK